MGKSSKSAKTDRQKVIDDVRRQQKRAEKRQGAVIVGVCVVIALGIVLIAAWEPMTTSIRKAALTGDTIEEIGAGADVCQEVLTEPQAGNTHVERNQQVQYEDAPPATGDHWNIAGFAPAPVSQRFYSENNRPELEQLVHNSEHGYNILWYDATVADDDGQVAQIQKIADIMDANDTNGRNKFKAVPWTSEDAEEVAASLDAAVTAAEDAVTAAEKAVEDASKKDEKSAQQQLDDARSALEEAEKAAESGGQFPEDQHIALTHWTADGQSVRQYCSEVSGEALQTFMFDYPYSDTPEPDAM